MLCERLVQARDEHILQTRMGSVYIIISLVPQNPWVTPDTIELH